MSVWDPIAGLPDLVGRFQFAKVSGQILRSFWHIGCKAVECLKGEKSLWKSGFCWAERLSWRMALPGTTSPVAASSGHIQQEISVFCHCGCQISTSPGFWSGTHTSKTTQVEMHTQTKTFLWLACFINTFRLKKNCPSFCTIPTLSPHSFLLSCTTVSTKQCFYLHLTVVSSWS